jgi:L,D-transpeptidase-like protein/putative peptidoglycan binding protein
MPTRHRRRRWPYVVLGVVILGFLAFAAGAIALKSSKPKLTIDPAALAKIDLPLGGGTIESLSAVTTVGNHPVPVHVAGHQIWPSGKVRVHTPLSISVVIKRPGWNAWLTGKTQRLNLSLITPSAHLLAHWLTVSSGQPLRLTFAAPVAAVASGPAPVGLKRQTLSTPQSQVTLPRSAPAGSIYVAAAPRTWEIAGPALVSWFPAGSGTTAVANPAPGSTIHASTPISLTFSKPVDQVLGGKMPPVSPITQGTWHTLNSHTIVFQPENYGYGLAAHVQVGLPSNVHLIGGKAAWSVPAGSTLRLQQLLAQLGYLPVDFHDSVANTPAAQESAAVHAPSGSFDWRWHNVPAALRGMWAPGTFGEMTKGAVMAFENDHGITPDGDPGPTVWKALIAAAVQGHRSTFGYTFVQVSEGSPESQSTWHNGKTVVSGPVNTGIPQAPTAKGVFAVFEHAPSVTMSGTNPDGSHYSDPGVPWVSYFNGGDALHGFLRASYGSAQSLGCVEMPYTEAHDVYQYTPIGTLVSVT